MPKVKITEADNTGAVQLDSVSNVVYIPGLASSDAVAPKLFTTPLALREACSDYEPDASYELAYRLLQLGMQVLFEGIEPEDSEIAPTDIDWERLQDLNAYNIRFLTTGAYAIPSDNMIKCAEKRGDCVALIDHSNSSKTVDAVRTEIEGILASALESGAEVGSSFCSAFTPWIEVGFNAKDATDTIELPGSAGYLLAYARSNQTNPTWYAAAGSFRGVISELKKPLVEYSKADCERLQARATDDEVELDDDYDNVGIAINPIAYIRPFGVIVWGNRTLLSNDGSTKATSFLNVRNLISTLKKELYFASNKYTFEQNNEVLWINFKSQVTPLLDKMQSGNGIEGYKLVRQATDKKARLKAKVTIIPIEAVEDFELEVSLEDSLEVVEG